MSIQNDIRLEALARKRGPPIGPRVKHHFIRDEEGVHVAEGDVVDAGEEFGDGHGGIVLVAVRRW